MTYLELSEAVEKKLKDKIESLSPSVRCCFFGSIKQYYGGLARIEGLKGLGYGELLSIGEGVPAMALDLDRRGASVALLEKAQVEIGAAVYRREKLVEVPVGRELLGRVVSPTGEPLDGGPPPEASASLPIERPAPAILDRVPVKEPLQTGIKAVDALIPIGHGQRELILGDRKTGKTTLAVDAILNQKEKGVICIYCSIGQRLSSVAKLLSRLRKEGAMDYTVLVAAQGDDPPGVRFICPYAATSIAEYFCSEGKRVLIVYDDLTTHARSYRELCLLLRRPPGREAYPGDIFYIHARLLERSANVKKAGSITALPIVETQEQDISAYIPTNLISITDGQVVLSTELFQKGILPAIDIGKSVSRVGGKAQFPAMRKIAGDLKLQYAQFEEMESFSKYETRLEKEVKETVQRGKRIRACLKQFEGVHLSPPKQLALFLALREGLFDSVEFEQMEAAQEKLFQALEVPEPIQEEILKGKKLSEENKERLLKLAREALAR